MHTIKIIPNLLFEYQCRPTSGKFITLPNRIESKLFSARIGMLYCKCANNVCDVGTGLSHSVGWTMINTLLLENVLMSICDINDRLSTFQLIITQAREQTLLDLPIRAIMFHQHRAVGPQPTVIIVRPADLDAAGHDDECCDSCEECCSCVLKGILAVLLFVICCPFLPLLCCCYICCKDD